jgi:hypothetical protein
MSKVSYSMHWMLSCSPFQWGMLCWSCPVLYRLILYDDWVFCTSYHICASFQSNTIKQLWQYFSLLRAALHAPWFTSNIVSQCLLFSFNLLRCCLSLNTHLSHISYVPHLHFPLPVFALLWPCAVHGSFTNRKLVCLHACIYFHNRGSVINHICSTSS